MVGVAGELGIRPASEEASEEDIAFALLAGERALHVEGDLRAARRWFETAYRQAEPGEDGHALARAALGLGGIWVHEHRTSATWGMVRARQRQALSLVDPDSPLALRLTARLCGEEDYRAGGHERILRVLAQARTAADPIALAETLSLAHHCLLGPGHLALRLSLAEELIGTAARTGRRGDLLMGLMWRTVDLFMAADPHAERSLKELRDLLTAEDHLAVGFVTGAIEVMMSTRAGRFDQAEALAGACAQRGAVAGDVDVTGWYGGQLTAIRWFQGRVAELLPSMTELAGSPTLSAVDNSPLAGLAVTAATAGDHRTATGLLARLPVADLPRSSSWLTTMYGIVEAAHLLRDADTAARAHELLLPYAGLPVIASLGVTCFGSVRHCLGMAMLTTGELDLAIEHLRAAVRANLALGHWPAGVLSRHRLGQALALRHGRHDEAARRETAQAAREADELGMTLPAPPVGSGAPPRPRGVCRMRRDGKQWLLEFGGRRVLVGPSVGLRHLAALVANPGDEIPATDLAAGIRAPESASASAQPVLDAAARDAYKQRLARLQAEIDDLEAMNDLERAAALRLEYEWLVAELASATGIGGRTRAFTGSEERARVAVGKAIRRALDRIAEADPVIGAELRVTVHTGVRCSYLPR